MIQEIRNKLIDLSENDYKEFTKTLCPDTKRKILGIRIPILRSFAKVDFPEPLWPRTATNSPSFISNERLLSTGLSLRAASSYLYERLTVLIKAFIIVSLIF